jgi:hypothetical protein
MTTYQNGWEGQTNAAAVTTANSATSGTALDLVSPGTGGAITYSNTWAAHGSISIKYANGSGAACQTGMAVNNLAVSLARYFYISDLPTDVAVVLIQGRTAAGPAFNVNINNSTGKLTLADSLGGTAGFSPASLSTLSLPKSIRVEVDALSDASAGTLAMRAFLGDSATVITGWDTGTVTGRNTRGGNLVDIREGKITSTTWTTPIYIDSFDQVDGATVPGPVGPGPYAVVVPNAIPTIAGGATATMTSGSTANITFTGNDSDGTIASFATPTVASSAPTPPTIGTPSYTGLGTASATVTFPVSGLSNGDHVFSDTTTDNSGGVSTVGTTRIIYTSTSPMRRSVTLSGVTMTSPGSGTALAALNAWQANPYNASTNPTGVAPPVFVTAGPPGAGAGVTEVYQPYAVGSTPNFYQSWAASDAVTPIPIYVDLKMGGTTYATATATLNSTSPVNVGRACTTSENTAIGTDRSLPSVVSRFS